MVLTLTAAVLLLQVLLFVQFVLDFLFLFYGTKVFVLPRKVNHVAYLTF